jgi:hypothetical protein
MARYTSVPFRAYISQTSNTGRVVLQTPYFLLLYFDEVYKWLCANPGHSMTQLQVAPIFGRTVVQKLVLVTLSTNFLVLDCSQLRELFFRIIVILQIMQSVYYDSETSDVGTKSPFLSRACACACARVCVCVCV